MAVEGAAEGPDEGEVDGLNDAAEQVVLGDELVERELVVEPLGDVAATHHACPS